MSAASERQRAFLALRGRVFPRPGQRGLFTRCWGDTRPGQVEVVRVSASGQTIWTRFVTREAQNSFGYGQGEHRWRRVSGRTMTYAAGAKSALAPHGHVNFPCLIPETAL